MSSDRISDLDTKFLASLEKLQKLRHFSGEPSRFWPACLDNLVGISDAEVGIIAFRQEQKQEQQQEQEDSRWRIIAVSPQNKEIGYYANLLKGNLDELNRVCTTDGLALLGQEIPEMAAVRLNTGVEKENCLAAFILKSMSKSQAMEKIRYLQVVSDIPASYQLHRVAVESKTRVEHFASVLDLMVLINAENRFLAAAMTFCNELASRHSCERVSLGWLDKGYIRLQAMSHVDHFDRKTEAVQKLEAAMEEAFDQDAEILLPQQSESSAITRDHQEFARSQDVSHTCSLPLRINEEPVAVCTFERGTRPFSEVELRLLRLSCDQATRRLADLKRDDRWFGARMAMLAREKLAHLLGAEHTWPKVIAVFVFLLFAFLCFGRLTYRVEAPFILRTDDVSYLTSPFDGHIDKVDVRLGDQVIEGDILLSLDQSDLLVEEAGLLSEKKRYQREFEKARASEDLADMRIAEALRDQADARLDLVRYRLKRSLMRAPFDGVIVEGDLMERIGSPLRQGDVLFKMARTEQLYAELEVSESDIHHAINALQGEIALASRPQEKFKIAVSRMEPVAIPKEEGNVFIVRCSFSEAPQGWWRPGMTGVAKLNIGKRTPLWILTHRTVDFLRLWLWW